MDTRTRRRLIDVALNALVVLVTNAVVGALLAIMVTYFILTTCG